MFSRPSNSVLLEVLYCVVIVSLTLENTGNDTWLRLGSSLTLSVPFPKVHTEHRPSAIAEVAKI